MNSVQAAIRRQNARLTPHAQRYYDKEPTIQDLDHFKEAISYKDASAPAVNRASAATFAETLLMTLSENTPKNMETCRDFIVNNILPSEHRMRGLSSYLFILSKEPGVGFSDLGLCDGFNNLRKGPGGKPIFPRPPKQAEGRLHVVFIFHDTLCYESHVRQAELSGAGFPRTNSILGEFSSRMGVVARVAACGYKYNRKVVLKLIKRWEEVGIFNTKDCDDLHAAVEADAKTKLSLKDLLTKIDTEEKQAAEQERLKHEEKTKGVYPKSHSLPNDPSTPWHELPAANALYQKRTTGFIKARALPKGGYTFDKAGQKDLALLAEVDDLYSDAVGCFEKYTKVEDIKDVDALGNVVRKDGQMKNYYGFDYTHSKS